jgi:hypothetical protein
VTQNKNLRNWVQRHRREEKRREEKPEKKINLQNAEIKRRKSL